MRNIVLALLAMSGVALAAAPAVAEIDYPYCMTHRFGGRECSFTSIQQCLATAAGLQANCFENPAVLAAQLGARAERQTIPVRRRHVYY
jgi:hypothetical protein